MKPLMRSLSGVVPDYPRSMKWRTLVAHPHARDANLDDAPEVIPSLRNRSSCPLCKTKPASSEVVTSVGFNVWLVNL